MMFKQPVMNPDSPEFASEQYLDDWYAKRKVLKAIGSYKGPVTSINKAIAPWDPPASPYNVYFDPVFNAEVFAWTLRDNTVFRLLRKETFQRLGDSYKYYAADVDAVTGVDGGSTPYTSGSVESGPTYASFEQFKPAYIMDPWETDWTSDIESEWQKYPANTVEELKAYHANKFPNALDVMLTKTVDTVANDGATYFNLESIDRICSDYTESGATTTFVSADTDGDIYWGKSTALIDRSTDTGDTYGASVDLPATAAARVLSLDMIDDVMAGCLDKAPSENYIMITGPRTINEIERLVEGKQRYNGPWVNGPIGVDYTVNGVVTRQGVDAGIAVASYVTNGIRIPIFANKHVVGENGLNESSKVTDTDIGNIYLINMDTVHIRVAVPTVYWQTPPEARLTGDRLKDRHAIMMGAQLICTNFQANGKVAYLKAA